MQALTAVHESGHAILFVLLSHVVPEVVFSGTTDPDVAGFVFSKNHFPLITFKEVIPRAAAYLGGIAAERIVFGEELVTNGSEGDIANATRLIGSMIKSSGMGPVKGSFKTKEPLTNNYLHDHYEAESEIKRMLNLAYELAMETLRREERLLIRLSNYLSDHRKIDKKALRAFIETNKSGKEPLKIPDPETPNYFRKRLKSINEKLNNEPQYPAKNYSEIYMNKDLK